jgi:protein involved in polysaccharide export with SLBB domain
MGKITYHPVYVGEVKQSGAYTISPVYHHQCPICLRGLTKNGTLRRIQLVRNGKTVQTLDLYNFLLRGDKSQDKTLQSDDTIFVPVIGPVAGVAGNVKRPAIYEVTPGTTLQQLVETAGGITPSGYLQRVHVERFVAHEKKVVVDLDLSTAPSPGTKDLWRTVIQDGDLISVLPIVTTLENVVNLEGHVIRPGRYELKPALATCYHTALLPEPYVDYADYCLPDRLRRQVVSFTGRAWLVNT